MHCSASLVGDGGAADASPGVPGTLVQNYRSHSSLLHIPNKLFYNQTLVAAADQSQLLPPAWSELELPDASLTGGQPSTQPGEENADATASAANEMVEDMVRVAQLCSCRQGLQWAVYCLRRTQVLHIKAWSESEPPLMLFLSLVSA